MLGLGEGRSGVGRLGVDEKGDQLGVCELGKGRYVDI